MTDGQWSTPARSRGRLPTPTRLRHSRSSVDRTPASTRGVAPTVGKLLEVGLALILVTGLVATLSGGAVPAYRDRAGAALAERELAGAATHLQRAVPPAGRWVRVQRRVPLPDRIRGERYRIVADGTRLRLVHPNPAVAAETRLALPTRVVAVTGTWHSDDRPVVVVESTADGVTIRLRGGGV